MRTFRPKGNLVAEPSWHRSSQPPLLSRKLRVPYSIVKTGLLLGHRNRPSLNVHIQPRFDKNLAIDAMPVTGAGTARRAGPTRWSGDRNPNRDSCSETTEGRTLRAPAAHAPRLRGPSGRPHPDGAFGALRRCPGPRRWAFTPGTTQYDRTMAPRSSNGWHPAPSPYQRRQILK